MAQTSEQVPFQKQVHATFLSFLCVFCHGCLQIYTHPWPSLASTGHKISPITASSSRTELSVPELPAIHQTERRKGKIRASSSLRSRTKLSGNEGHSLSSSFFLPLSVHFKDVERILLDTHTHTGTDMNHFASERSGILGACLVP